MVVPDNAVDITLDVAKDAPSGSMLATDLVESCRDLNGPSLLSFWTDMHSMLWVEKHDVASIIIGFLNLIV